MLWRIIFYFRIHPRDKQDVAHRLSLGARAVAYGEKGISFQGPFPEVIVSSESTVNVTYDQEIFVTPSKDIFEVRLTAECRCYSIHQNTIKSYFSNSIQKVKFAYHGNPLHIMYFKHLLSGRKNVWKSSEATRTTAASACSKVGSRFCPYSLGVESSWRQNVKWCLSFSIFKMQLIALLILSGDCIRTQKTRMSSFVPWISLIIRSSRLLLKDPTTQNPVHFVCGTYTKESAHVLHLVHGYA